MRQAEAIPVTVEDEEAQKLLERLAPGLYERMLEIIDANSGDVQPKSISIYTTTESEDPSWEELVFDVRVDTTTDDALAYWNRVGESFQGLIDASEGEAREQLVRFVSIYVSWS